MPSCFEGMSRSTSETRAKEDVVLEVRRSDLVVVELPVGCPSRRLRGGDGSTRDHAELVGDEVRFPSSLSTSILMRFSRIGVSWWITHRSFMSRLRQALVVSKRFPSRALLLFGPSMADSLSSWKSVFGGCTGWVNGCCRTSDTQNFKFPGCCIMLIPFQMVHHPTCVLHQRNSQCTSWPNVTGNKPVWIFHL